MEMYLSQNINTKSRITLNFEKRFIAPIFKII